MKKIIPIIFLLILSFWSIKPLFNQGFFPVHDNVQVERVYEMGRALREGQFPVRWVGDLGYGFGYPIFNFYAPLPYYVGGFFNFLGLDAIVATKLMFGIGILLAVISMYILASSFWGRLGGMLSAVLYLYSPYHALDIYVRGAVDEFWAMAFLPLVFLGLYKIYKNGSPILGSLTLAAVILSHNLTAFMLIPFLVIFFLILLRYSPQKKHFILNTLYLILLALLLSAFYWFPALLEMKYTNVLSQIVGGADFRKHFIDLTQIWDFPWGFGGSAGLQSGISYKIGKLNIVLFIISVLFFFFQPKKLKIYKPIVLLSMVGFIAAIIMTNKISLGLWEVIRPLSFIQFPWRYLEFAVFFSCLLAGIAVSLLIPKFKVLIVVILVIAVLFYQNKYFEPQQYIQANSSQYTNQDHLNWEASKISDEYLPLGFPIPKYSTDTANREVLINPQDSFVYKKYNFKSATFSKIVLPVAKFPGWEVSVDRQRVMLSNSPLLSMTVPAGAHTIEAKFVNTPVRIIGNLLSLIGLIITVVMLTKMRYSNVKL